MATKRLIGKDGAVAKVTKGTTIDGDGATPLTVGWYVVKSVLATGSGLPTNSEEKTVFYTTNETGSIITPELLESVIPITFTKLCDSQNISVEFTKGEVETTTFCDTTKTYRAGLTDASGTLDGITTMGVTDEDGGLIERFVKKLEQSSDLSEITITEIDDGNLYLQIDVNSESTSGEDIGFYLMPVAVTSYSAGVQAGDNAQTFSSSFRIAPDDDIETVFYKRAII